VGPAVGVNTAHRRVIVLSLLLALFLNCAEGKEAYMVRIAAGKASSRDFSEILSMHSAPHDADIWAAGMDGGWRFAENAFEWPLDFELRGGLYRFLEHGYQDDFFEGLLFLKLFWKIDLWEERIRLGVGEGLSYTESIAYVERLEAEQKNDNNAYLLNYLEVTADFDLGRLLRYPPLFETYLGYLLKHRSGVSGLFGNVHEGGSNYNCLYIERHF
jgi:outer membrane protein